MDSIKKQFSVSSAPHIHANDSTALLMLDVITALMPATIAGVWLFGWGALRTILISVVFSVLFEYLWQKITKQPVRINDLSAAVTGLILALCLPSTSPWWMVVVGDFFAIIIVKQLFGGIGDNFINPAMAARAALLASWPAFMAASAFVTPYDAVSTATPIAVGKAAAQAVSAATPNAELAVRELTDMELFLGVAPGCIGEVSKLAILIGLAYLLIRKTITWHIPVTLIASFMLFTWILGGDPVRGVLTGSVLFGAVFMATDYVTSPMSKTGQLIYAAGAGLIIALIRAFGSYPEGTTYGILLMNVATPLIDRVTRRRIYGEVRANAK